MNLTRYPDAPIASSLSVLGDLRETTYCAQFKMDGWRCLIELMDGGTIFTSRHNKPLPVSESLRQQIGGVLLANAHPKSIFDAEWMGRRDGQPEAIVLFDVLRNGSTWVTSAPMIDRFLLLQDIAPHELIVAHTWTHYAEFFEASKRPGVEGIVLKRADSRYIASPRGCANNPGWMKIRHKLPVSLAA